MGTRQINKTSRRGLEFAPGITTSTGGTDLSSIEVLSRNCGISNTKDKGGIKDACRCLIDAQSTGIVSGASGIWLKDTLINWGLLKKPDRLQRSLFRR